MLPTDYSWPIFVEDRRGRTIYMTWERWEHALGHPGMDDNLLEAILETIKQGSRKQDKYITLFLRNESVILFVHATRGGF
ncbi:hypothetical protein KFU94_44910 [Chloroflexi bacterium TSY]|nr:hypothetical protein [Chloroflexi bacterium TSY]